LPIPACDFVCVVYELQHLTENTDYIVIGAVGPQGCGKSTVLSMLGGNNEMDMYRQACLHCIRGSPSVSRIGMGEFCRQYVFRPASREAMETCRHQTTGVHIYVTKTRVILIDCQVGR
jgi:protein SMG9